MKQLELAIEFLNKRAISSKSFNSKIMQCQHPKVLCVSEVKVILSMVISGEFEEFYEGYSQAETLMDAAIDTENP